MILARNIGRGSFGVPGARVFEPGEERPVSMAAAKFCSGRREFVVTFPDPNELPYKDADGRVRYLGFAGAVDSRFGYGSAGITIMQALDLAGVETSCAIAPYTPDLPENILAMTARRDYIPKVEILHSTPDWFGFAQSPISIAWTMWETSKIPNTDAGPYGGNWVEKLNKMEGIIVPCHYNKDVFEACGVHTPIAVIPYAVDPEPWPLQEREDRDQFVVFQFGDLSQRKGPLEAVEAFQLAFPQDQYPECRLLLKTFAGRFATGSMQFAPEFTDTRIKIIDATWTRAQLVEQMQKSDCGIWLSRGEGFGLPPVQMALTGLPVVMTVNSGMAEYYDEKYFYGVPDAGMSPAPLGGDWFEPDVEAAAAKLQAVYSDRAAAKKKGKAAAKALRKSLSLEVMSSRLMDYLGGF